MDKVGLCPDLSPDPDNVTLVESLCMNCEKNGETRLLLTTIPHFKQIVISAFECNHCGYRNNNIESVGDLNETGQRITLNLSNPSDLNRQIVKSEFASIQIPSLEFEIPGNGRACLSTIEGIISKAITDLEEGQAERAQSDFNVYERIRILLMKLNDLLNAESFNEFILVVDDPSGNSHVENPLAPKHDPSLKIVPYKRTMEQLQAMGYAPEIDAENSNETPIKEEEEAEEGEEAEAFDVLKDNVIKIPCNCSSCGRATETRMHMVNIPYFKDVVIMAVSCEHCGYKSNDVKSGGEISEKGKRIFLKINDIEDLSRDILKSETAGLHIPEVGLELACGSLGGRFTTIEGMLQLVKDELLGKVQPFSGGDSAPSDRRQVFSTLLNNIDMIMEGKLSCTLVLDDPLANSHIQNIYAPDPDPSLSFEMYERTYDQNEDLGLNDIKTENYQQ